MFRIRSLVLTGVVAYGIILVAIHQVFMSGMNEAQNDALLQAILRDQSRLLKLKAPTFVQQVAMPNIQGSFNPGLLSHITANLNSTSAMQNITANRILKEWDSIMKPVTGEGVLKNLSMSGISRVVIDTLEKYPRLMEYSTFNITLPNLLSKDDVESFAKYSSNSKILGVQSRNKLFGKINILHNATLTLASDCGYQTINDDFYPKRKSYFRSDFVIDGVIIPLLVPDSFAFQHFIDGLLPKLIQVLDLALLPGVQILIFHPRDNIIFEMLEALGISQEKLVYFPAHDILLKTMINTCITPPLHPLLWGAARRLLGVADQLSDPQDSLVILLTRAKTSNPGRKMINVNEVKNMLAMKYGARLVVFKGGLNLRQTKALFGRASIILGVHGGAFYNQMFAPRSAHIIEFMPWEKSGRPIAGVAHQIFWLQSQLIGQTYWRLQLIPQTFTGDVLVPISNLTSILKKVDMSRKQNSEIIPNLLLL